MAAPSAADLEEARARVTAAGEAMRAAKGDKALSGLAHAELLAAKAHLKTLNALVKK